jgi:hypothetical protein
MFNVSGRFEIKDLQVVYEIIRSISDYEIDELEIKKISQLELVLMDLRPIFEMFSIKNSENGETIEFKYKKNGPDGGIYGEIRTFVDSATNEQIVQIKIRFSPEYVSKRTSKIISLIECYELDYSDN